MFNLSNVYIQQLCKLYIIPTIATIDMHVYLIYKTILKYFDEKIVYYIVHDLRHCEKKIFRISYIPIYFIKYKSGFEVKLLSTSVQHTEMLFYEYIMVKNCQFKRLLTTHPLDKNTKSTYKKFDIFSIKGVADEYVSMSRYITNSYCDAKHLSLVFRNSVSNVSYIDDNLDEIKLSKDELVPITNI